MQCSFRKFVPKLKRKVDCGRCISCRINKTSQWAVRLLMELPYWDSACFITLTFDDEHLPSDRSVHVEEMQNFFKRVRKNTGCVIKYYYCGEYGDINFRPHYHAIVFGIDFSPWIYLRTQSGRKVFTSDLLADCWQHRGEVTVDEVTPDDCAYVAGYVQKKLYGEGAAFYEQNNLVPPFAHQSNGISLRYSQDHAEQLRRNMYVWYKGHRSPLPHYVADKVGLCEKDFYGNSAMFYHAQEIIVERHRKFIESDLLDRYSDYVVPYHPEGYMFALAKYEEESGIQRELELREKQHYRSLK